MATVGTCSSCNEAVSSDEMSVSCGECKGLFHIGTCAGLSDKQYKKKSESAKQKWTCSACRVAGKDSEGSSGKSSADELTDIRSLLADISQKLDELLPLKETVPGIERRYN